MLNPFFLQGSKTEQGLVQDLVNEQLKIYGVEIYYIQRQYLTTNNVIAEVIQSEFTHAHPIEAYVNTLDGYGGQGTILSKFGVQDIDELVVTISKERFESEVPVLTKNLPGVRDLGRPKEGDLIFFPLGERLFEIKYVEHEKPFYQLQKNYVYELRCELFRYEDEVLDTGISQIDETVESEGYIQTLDVIGLGVTATASAKLVDGGVRLVSITNRGSNYDSQPQVKFSQAGIGGSTTAVGITTMIGNIVDLCGPDPSKFRVQGVDLVNAGSGYTTAPSVAFVGGGGSGVAATTIIGDGVIGYIDILSGGSNYFEEPIVTVDAPGSGNPTARVKAIVSAAGTISNLYLVDAGMGYSVPPTITISPPTIVGVGGTFIKGETVTGSSSGATALVKGWNVVTGKLDVYQVSGEFRDFETVVGSASSAEYKLKPINTYNIKDGFAQNDDIEFEADQLLDFSEKNPFGNP